MQCEARSPVNQGESEGVDLRPRLKMSPPICQEIAHNAPPQVVFFTKNEIIPTINAFCELWYKIYPIAVYINFYFFRIPEIFTFYHDFISGLSDFNCAEQVILIDDLKLIIKNEQS